jgi:4'-phosphopantetheinyl transferase
MTAIRYLLHQRVTPHAGSAWLTTRERAIDAHFRLPKPREDWRLGRWTGKHALAIAAGIGTDLTALRRIQILPRPTGAPQAMLDGVPAPHALSLSHSADTALCAVAPRGIAVGCDVEGIDERSEAFVDTFFTPDEMRLWSEAAADERDLLATLIWSAKESALKVLEVGLRMDTRDVEVSLEAPSLGSGSGQPGWRRLRVDWANGASAWGGWWREAAGMVLTFASEMAERPPQPLG